MTAIFTYCNDLFRCDKNRRFWRRRIGVLPVPESLAEECVAEIYKEYQRTETHKGQEYGDPDDESSINTVISYN